MAEAQDRRLPPRCSECGVFFAFASLGRPALSGVMVVTVEPDGSTASREPWSGFECEDTYECHRRQAMNMWETAHNPVSVSVVMEGDPRKGSFTAFQLFEVKE